MENERGDFILHFFIYIVQTGNKRRDGVIPPYTIPFNKWSNIYTIIITIYRRAG